MKFNLHQLVLQVQLAAVLRSATAIFTRNYFGVPIGSFFNSVSQTSGDVYLSNAATITIAHFHFTGQPNCDTFVVGSYGPEYQIQVRQQRFMIHSYLPERLTNLQRRRKRSTRSRTGNSDSRMRDIYSVGRNDSLSSKDEPIVTAVDSEDTAFHSNVSKFRRWSDQAGYGESGASVPGEKTPVVSITAKMKELTYLSKEMHDALLTIHVEDLAAHDWFGLYDHCDHTPIVLANLRGHPPPTPFDNPGFISHEYGIYLSKMTVEDCNTVLFMGFTFHSEASKNFSGFLCATDESDEGVPLKVYDKFSSDGWWAPATALRNYFNETLLIKLPFPVITLDISAFAICDPTAGTVYAYAPLRKEYVPVC